MTHLGNDERLSLAGRLDLLEDSGVITPGARRVTSAAIGRIEDLLLVTLDDESGGPLVTHIAVALSRIERNEPPPELPEIVALEIADRPEELRMAEGLAQEWQATIGAPIPAQEVTYVAAHLAALRDREARL
ncbi:MAG: PRD domain-containing protein [Chloroflexota bacterium]|nr:PRD domain-containing protein [Chloroflexota bacterium]